MCEAAPGPPGAAPGATGLGEADHGMVAARFGRALARRWLPQIVVSPLFAASLFFVYGFIAWTVYISFTRSGVLPNYELAGLLQYERLWSTPRWYVALSNLLIFWQLFMCRLAS
jgi:glucose/mannose transport system permease protein